MFLRHPSGCRRFLSVEGTCDIFYHQTMEWLCGKGKNKYPVPYGEIMYKVHKNELL